MSATPRLLEHLYPWPLGPAGLQRRARGAIQHSHAKFPTASLRFWTKPTYHKTCQHHKPCKYVQIGGPYPIPVVCLFVSFRFGSRRPGELRTHPCSALAMAGEPPADALGEEQNQA